MKYYSICENVIKHCDGKNVRSQAETIKKTVNESGEQYQPGSEGASAKQQQKKKKKKQKEEKQISSSLKSIWGYRFNAVDLSLAETRLLRPSY